MFVAAVFGAFIQCVAEMFDAFFRAGRCVHANDGIRFEEIGVDDEVVVLLDRRIQSKMLLEEADQLRGGTIESQIGSE